MSIVYLNKTRPLLINSEIIEWDIKSANISIIKAYKLLPEDMIEKIENMPKKARNVTVGKIGMKDKTFMSTLEDKFTEVVERFINENNLDMNYDVLSVKRDAVFVINRNITSNSQMGAINFIPKNIYTGFIYIKPYEFYWTGKDVEMKNLSIDYQKLHTDGILSFIKDIFILASRNDFKRLKLYLVEFVNAYKKKELPFDFYRTFDSMSKFTIYFDYGDRVIMSDNVDESLLKNLDISYNYINIVLPICRLFI